jgi:hypothetical protein
LKNEKSYFQAEFGNFKNSESDKAEKNRMQNLIQCDLKKNGPDSSSEAKVMAVLSLDSESGFLARCRKGGWFGFFWIGSVLEIGSILWIGSVVEIRSILWIWSV